MKRIAKTLSLSLCAATLLLPCSNTHAQTETPAETKPKAAAAPLVPPTPEEAKINARVRAIRNRDYSLDPFKTFYLKPGSAPNDGNEILTGMRQILDPSVKMYLLPSLNAIVVRGTPEDLALAEKLLVDIDRGKKNYKLTYTITESEAGKRIGVQRFTMIVVGNGRTTLKNGSKVPVATGSYNSGSQSSQTQFTYLDVGLNFDASIDDSTNGMRLRSKVEQSSAAEEKLISGVSEPVIRQSVLESTSILMPGQAQMLGSLDIAGSTRHLDIEVVAEPVR